ncbi:FHA domain-containing protein [Marinagarivorans algicola]|uniref:FHA domain-containing protein n=1 Tax=Marinagarivorans algicola TaxID=1513270 RepID=UPI0006B64DCA|nr:FHA domain-containing protein [Marinagarivorans algicola]
MLKLQFNDDRQDPVWMVEKNFTIGSGDDNSLVIDDASVSPQHAKITCTRQTYVLKDLGSAAGTRVNNQAVNQHAVACRDTLKFGDVELTIVDPATEQRDYEWSLIASSSFLTGQEFPLRSQNNHGITIGRGKHCDIAFPGTHLSKEHARFTPTPKGLHVKDLSSENGVFVNDKRVPQALLRAGDKVRLDVYSFRVFGPGIDTPRSAITLMRETEKASNSDDEPTEVPKQWVTRPTSPGNRSESRANANSPPPMVYLFSFIMVGLLLGLSAYLFL